jgi:hypothetical protein
MAVHHPLEIKTCGIILGTENFDDCVHFYRDIIGLPVWYVKTQLVCLRFGDGYLMIETRTRPCCASMSKTWKRPPKPCGLRALLLKLQLTTGEKSVHSPIQTATNAS